MQVTSSLSRGQRKNNHCVFYYHWVCKHMLMKVLRLANFRGPQGPQLTVFTPRTLYSNWLGLPHPQTPPSLPGVAAAPLRRPPHLCLMRGFAPQAPLDIVPGDPKAAPGSLLQIFRSSPLFF